jgi:hypothetical protein
MVPRLFDFSHLTCGREHVHQVSMRKRSILLRTRSLILGWGTPNTLAALRPRRSFAQVLYSISGGSGLDSPPGIGHEP